MSDYPVIPPYEQAYLLNKQLIARAHLFRNPVITIGGQAIQYWVSYYHQLYRNALPDARLITSVDVDYAARRHDITAIAHALGVDANLNDAGQPPSLARFVLTDAATRSIKAVKGRFFADPAQPAHANTVDVIDFPSGFTWQDFAGENLLLNTEPFYVSQEHPDEPEYHEQVRVINPLACLRSRFSNLQTLQRDPLIEVARINAMMLPCVYFLLEKFDAVSAPDEVMAAQPVSFRAMKRYADALYAFAMQEDVVRVQVRHEIALYRIFEQLIAIFAAEPESYNVPAAFWQKELPVKAADMKKYVERIRQDKQRRLQQKKPLHKKQKDNDLNGRGEAGNRENGLTEI